MSPPLVPTVVRTEPARAVPADVIDIRVVLTNFWAGKWLLLIAVVLGLLYGMRTLRGYEPVYEAQMVVLPIQTQQPGALSGSGGGLQALGITLGARTVSNFDRLQLALESMEFANLMNEKYGLLARVFADTWDAKAGQWIRPNDATFRGNESLRKTLKLNTWQEPSVHSLGRYLKAVVKFKSQGAEQFHRVTFSHRDAEFALWLLTTSYREAEDLIRKQDAAENLRRRQYLEEQLGRATAIEVRQSLAQLITNEERQAMLMQGSLPYVGRIVIAPYVGERQTEPEFVSIFGTNVLVGLGIAALMLLLWTIVTREVLVGDEA